MNSSRSRYRGFILPAALAVLATAALAIDMPIAGAFRIWDKSPLVGPYLGYFDMFEMFGHGVGVIFLVFALHQLDPGQRWAIPRVLACAFGAGGLANLLKMLIMRTRPYQCDDLSGSVWMTFGQWFGAFCGGCDGQSFPSAHTATAFGFAAALIWLYPNGRLLFTLLAALVGCQRIICGAHYPSDVLAGAAAGCVLAQFVLYIGWLPGWFVRMEKELGSGGVQTTRPEKCEVELSPSPPASSG